MDHYLTLFLATAVIVIAALSLLMMHFYEKSIQNYRALSIHETDCREELQKTLREHVNTYTHERSNFERLKEEFDKEVGELRKSIDKQADLISWHKMASKEDAEKVLHEQNEKEILYERNRELEDALKAADSRFCEASRERDLFANKLRQKDADVQKTLELLEADNKKKSTELVKLSQELSAAQRDAGERTKAMLTSRMESARIQNELREDCSKKIANMQNLLDAAASEHNKISEKLKDTQERLAFEFERYKRTQKAMSHSVGGLLDTIADAAKTFHITYMNHMQQENKQAVCDMLQDSFKNYLKKSSGEAKC